MAKKKNNTTVVNNIDSVNLEIDYDKLAEAIVKARKKEEEQLTKEKQETFNEWRKSLGYKDYSDKRGFVKLIYTFGNRFLFVLRLMFISKKRKIEISFSATLLQTILVGVFNVLKHGALLSSLVLLVLMFYHPNVVLEIYHYFILFCFAISSFVYSRFFRLVSMEIDQMNDKEQLLSLFTAVIALVPLVELVTDFLKGVG